MQGDYGGGGGPPPFHDGAGMMGGPPMMMGGGGGGPFPPPPRGGPGGPPGGGRPGAALFKTKLCTMFMQSGACSYGDRCSFAHGEAELQQMPQHFGGGGGGGFFQQQRKTRLCNRFNAPGGCPYGDACNFIHGDPPPGAGGGGSQLALLPGPYDPASAQPGHPPRAPAPKPLNYKTRMCVRFEAGSCPFGDRCHFAHGQEELRDIEESRELARQQQRREEAAGPGNWPPRGERLNPPSAPARFLFAPRSLEPRPAALAAPPADPDSALAKIRAANKIPPPSGEDQAAWADQGGSDLYGDSTLSLQAVGAAT